MKKPLHILLDGTDNVGKTTMCQLLSDKLRLPIIKMPNMPEYLKKGQAEEFSKLFNETIVQFKDTDFILDRGFTSSLVYSAVFNRDFDLSYLAQIEKELNPVVFILTGHPFATDEIYNTSQQERIDERFRLLAEIKKYHIVEVNDKTPEQIVNRILELL